MLDFDAGKARRFQLVPGRRGACITVMAAAGGGLPVPSESKMGRARHGIHAPFPFPSLLG